MALAPKALRLIELRFVVALAVVVPGVAWPAFGPFAWFCLRPADDSGAVRRQDAVDRRADALLLGAAEAARAGGSALLGKPPPTLLLLLPARSNQRSCAKGRQLDTLFLTKSPNFPGARDNLKQHCSRDAKSRVLFSMEDNKSLDRIMFCRSSCASPFVCSLKRFSPKEMELKGTLISWIT